MKKLFVVVALSLGLWGATAIAAPRLQVEPQEFEFGQVMDGIMVQATFTLTNVGDEPLVFPQKVHTSCGCTSAPLERDRLAPGESMELVVYFDSTGFGGQEVERTAELYTNDPQREKTILIIRGYVEEAAPFQDSASSLNYSFYVLVDLRSPEEFARGHLLGAVNIPFQELSEWLDRLPREVVVYLYDTDGEKGAQAAQFLQEAGYLAARAISGGLLGWWEAVGDAFFVWGEGVEPIAPTGTPYYGGYVIQPQYVARSYQVILDLRSPEEYAAGHFPGAVSLTHEQLPEWVTALPPIGRGKLYIWCVDADGGSACQAAQWLRQSGFPDARCITGGLREWQIRYGDSLLWAETG